MINSKIYWKNIYYMICYCVEELNYFQEADIDYEDIKGTHNLLAKLLTTSFTKLYKLGYIKRYIKEEIVTNKPYGEINIAKSIETGVYGQGKLVCTVDKLDIDNKFNQIIKAAFNILINTNDIISNKIDRDLMIELIKCKELLNKVTDIEITSKDTQLSNNIPDYYKPVMIISKFIIDEWIAKDDTGEHRILELNDRIRLRYIWEKFLRRYIREYLNTEKLSRYNYHTIKTTCKDGEFTREIDMVIKSDDMPNIIVADAKWYENEKDTVHNSDQINRYCAIIKERFKDKNVTGILMYACSSLPTYQGKVTTTNMGNKSAEYYKLKYFINIAQEFDKIKNDINKIVNEYLDL